MNAYLLFVFNQKSIFMDHVIEVEEVQQPLIWFRALEWQPCWIGLLGFFFVDMCVNLDLSISGFSAWEHNPRDAFANQAILPLVVVWLFVSLWTALYVSRTESWKGFPLGFLVVFTVSMIAKFLSAQSGLKQASLGDSVWAILFGVLVSNVIFWKLEIPPWLKVALQTELYIATSLVLLLVDFTQLAHLGSKAFFVAWIDTPVLTILMTYLGYQFLEISLCDSLIITCTTMICGSSAAMAITSSLGLPRTRADLPIAISSIFTVPMMIGLPLAARALQLSDYAAGAWFGGCVDSTGAVMATAKFLDNDDVTSAGAIVKMVQNILIAPFSVIVSIMVARRPEMWNLLINHNDRNEEDSNSHWLKMLWQRFPKFVLGFITTALLLNLTVSEDKREVCKTTAFYISEWYSTFSFFSIGMSLRWKNLPEFKNIINFVKLYVLTQFCDVVVTALLAWIIFN